MKKYNQLQQYQKKTFTNCLLSKFIYKNLQIIPKKLDFGIKVVKKLMDATQFLYLFLLTQQKPYVKKEPQTIGFKAKNNRNRFLNIEKKIMQELKIKVKKNRKGFFFLSKVVFEIIPRQFRLEQRIMHPAYTKTNLTLNLGQALLLKETVKLKSKHNYFSEFELEIEGNFGQKSIYEKVFSLKHLGLVEKLESIIDLNFVK